MRTIKLIIGFDGTRYAGWQSQKKNKTLQDVFEKSLEKILKEKVHLISSSRTDSGVHALGLCAHFHTKSLLLDENLKQALNYYLPKDIVVLSAQTVGRDFHARYHAKSKIYIYRIWNDKTRPLFEASYTLWHPHALPLSQMRKAAKSMLGRHDFRAFQDKGDERKTYIRDIKRLQIRKNKQMVTFEIEANGFLRHMVRIVIGTLLEVSRNRIKPESIKNIIRSKDRTQAGPTAKAHGLTLVKVKY